MGKITDALRKVRENREAIKKTGQAGATSDGAVTAGGVISPAKQRTPKKALPSFQMPLRFNLKDFMNRIFTDAFYIAVEKDDSGIDPRVVTYYNYSSPISEQYRILRTNIKSLLSKNRTLHSSDNATRVLRDSRIFALTSSLHSEGKTLTSINLAAALAKDIDSKVLIIDCDLRNGSVHRYLNIQNEPGMSDILQYDLDYREAIRPTNIPNLFALTSGGSPEHPSELLGSRNMRTLLEKLRAENFSYIVIDTPPLDTFTDAGVVGALTEGVVMVVQASRTPTKKVEKSLESLSHARAHVLGFILTQSDYYIPDMYSYYYYRHRSAHKPAEEETVSV